MVSTRFANGKFEKFNSIVIFKIIVIKIKEN